MNPCLQFEWLELKLTVIANSPVFDPRTILSRFYSKYPVCNNCQHLCLLCTSLVPVLQKMIKSPLLLTKNVLLPNLPFYFPSISLELLCNHVQLILSLLNQTPELQACLLPLLQIVN